MTNKTIHTNQLKYSEREMGGLGVGKKKVKNERE